MTILVTMNKINRRIPGILPPPPKAEIDGKITNLASKTIPELLELRDRQLKLLNHKSFISKLPDKGIKIQSCYDKINAELLSKQEEEQACRLLSNMNINVDNELIQDVEWNGEIASSAHYYLDSDDDSEPEDLLQILSHHTATEKKVKVLQPGKPLITPADLVNTGESHIQYIVNLTENNLTPKLSGHFKPYRTTKSDVHKPEKEILRKKHKHWEVTAATPPPIIHSPAKVLSLEESLKLQKDYNTHLKEVEAMHAAEKLLAQSNIRMSELPKDLSRFVEYREVDSEHSDESDAEGSDKEVHDEEPDRGGVVFTIMK